MSQTIIAHFYDCHTWQELKQQCDQYFESSSMQLPMYYLMPHEIASFKFLVDKYQDQLKVEFQSKEHLPVSLIALIVNKDFGAIEHYQIEQILNSYAEYEDDFDSFKRTLEWGEYAANRVIDSLLSWKSVRRPVSIWLKTSTYQQNIYAYCQFNDIDDSGDKNVFLKVQEWCTDIQIPKSQLPVCNLNWYVKYMIGFIEMLAQQFLTLGYQPIFEVCKIQNVHLSSLTSAHENKNHPQHGVYKLARSLLEYGGAINNDKKFDEITNKRGIWLTFPKKL